MKYKCFVAMALNHEDSDAVYDKQIRPVAAAKDVDARRVDRIPHNDDIDDKIIEEIKSADFVIADLTYARPSVYFEAGYAERAGTQVIYTCRRDHLSRGANDNLRVHFDLEHRNIIPWVGHADTEFQTKLSERIDLVLAAIVPKSVESKASGSHAHPDTAGLSLEARTLLLAASSDANGRFHRVRAQDGDEFVTNGQTLTGGGGVRGKAKMKDGFLDLEKREFVRDTNPPEAVMYEVTGLGHEAADVIRPQELRRKARIRAVQDYAESLRRKSRRDH